MEDQAENQEDTPELFLFLASTAHDMKNSISVLTGTLEGLLAGADEKDIHHPAYPQLAQMLYQTKRLNDNLIQLLALYKQVGKPEYPFDPRPQHIGELVQQVASQAKVLLESKKIVLEADFPRDMVWTFDEDLIIGMLTQAINNAVRYTHDTIRIAVAENEGFLEIRIEDNGAGFPQAMIEAGESAMSGNTAGVNFLTNSSGLGLYFASEVAKMHKYRQRTGGIRLENGGKLGGGVFVVQLP